MGKFLVLLSILAMSFMASAQQSDDPQLSDEFGSARVEVVHCQLPNQKDCKRVVSHLDSGVAKDPTAPAITVQGEKAQFSPKAINSKGGNNSGQESSSQ